MRIAELDGLRAIAILAVLAVHIAPERVPGGFLGVDLFFVLSGFLITSLLLAEERRTGTVSLGAFFARRALRILPPLSVAIAIALGIGVARPAEAVPVVFFFANFIPMEGGLAHGWSLSVEEQFYAVWPLVFLLVPNRKALLAAACVGALVFRLALASPEVHGLTPARMDSLAFGCLVAILPISAASAAWAWAAFITLLCTFAIAQPDARMHGLGFSLIAMLCAAMIGALMGAPKDSMLNRALRVPALRYIGLRSYGLYLYHYPIFMAIHEHREFLGLGKYSIAVLKLAAAFVVAEVSYRSIERIAAKASARFRTPVRSIAPDIPEARVARG